MKERVCKKRIQGKMLKQKCFFIVVCPCLSLWTLERTIKSRAPAMNTDTHKHPHTHAAKKWTTWPHLQNKDSHIAISIFCSTLVLRLIFPQSVCPHTHSHFLHKAIYLCQLFPSVFFSCFISSLHHLLKRSDKCRQRFILTVINKLLR